MRLFKNLYSALIILPFCFLTNISLAADCTSSPAVSDMNGIKTALENSKDNDVICFQSTSTIKISETLIINKPITVSNLQLASKQNPITQKYFEGPFLIFSASNASFLDSTLTGPGTGTAIQVNGTDTTIEGSTIFKFSEGIKVNGGGTVKLINNIYAGIDPANMFLPSDVTSPIDSALLGKHVSDTDVGKVDYVKGKLNLDVCTGTIEMYGEQIDKTKYLGSSFFQKHNSANCEIQSNLNIQFEDSEEQTFACGFTCDDFSEELSAKATFTYTSEPDLKVGTTGATTPFVPMPIQKFSDLPDVIFSTATPPSIPSDLGSNMNKEGSTVYVEQFGTGAGDGTNKINNEKLFIDTGNQKVKEETLDPDNTNGDPPDEQISGSASAASPCTLITSANSPQAWPLLIWLMGLPAILLRRFRN